ncbi:hypothetical protein [Kribbella qitaiheensis]|nr:hypothetical protein [Kribbella qitaiheensis]
MKLRTRGMSLLVATMLAVPRAACGLCTDADWTDVRRNAKAG